MFLFDAVFAEIHIIGILNEAYYIAGFTAREAVKVVVPVLMLGCIDGEKDGPAILQAVASL